jgi:hypothetical protein
MNTVHIDRTHEFTSRLIQQLAAPTQASRPSAEALARAYAAAFASR